MAKTIEELEHVSGGHVAPGEWLDYISTYIHHGEHQI